MIFKPTLENYMPVGNRLLLKIVGTDKIGEVFLPKTILDRWMPVAKLGTVCSLAEIGDMVLLGHSSVPPEKFTFDGVNYIQVAEHDIIGIVKGDDSDPLEKPVVLESNISLA